MRRGGGICTLAFPLSRAIFAGRPKRARAQGKQPGDVRFDGLGKINSIDSDD